ncbi:MAG: polysaccharide deacetylase family protein [Deltaproteobacteria bacterium]|nr:polysaccharide deacetylase family protein [Deltaproteobacteria bacterium]
MRWRWFTVFGSAMLAGFAAPASAEPGDTQVLTWPDGARAAVSVTMDDGYANQWRYMAPLLASRGYRGTFFLITSWMDAENLWPAWQAVAAAGHEIGSHTVNHVGLTELDAAKVKEELETSRARIQKVIGPEHGRTFGFPFSKSSAATALAVEQAGYEAARTGGEKTNPDTPQTMFLVQSRHPLAATPLAEMNGWVDEVKKSGGWLVVGVHGVVDAVQRYPASHEGWEPVPLERYVAFVDHLAAAGSALWVAPFGEAARYVRARTGAGVKVLERGPRQFVLEFVAPAASPPLSLRTELPETWAEVNVTGLGPALVVLSAPANAEGKRFVTYRARPPATVTIWAAAVPVASQADAGPDARPTDRPMTVRRDAGPDGGEAVAPRSGCEVGGRGTSFGSSGWNPWLAVLLGWGSWRRRARRAGRAARNAES